MAKGPYGGFIVVKGGDGRKTADRKTYKQFYGPVDRGSAKPAFCYPGRVRALEDEVRSMERAVENIPGDRKMAFEADLKKRKARLDQIREGEENAKKMFKEDETEWRERYTEIKREISEHMPSKKAVRDKRVNPHKVMKDEKSGFGELKREFQVLSHLVGEESNVGFLQRENDTTPVQGT